MNLQKVIQLSWIIDYFAIRLTIRRLVFTAEINRSNYTLLKTDKSYLFSGNIFKNVLKRKDLHAISNRAFGLVTLSFKHIHHTFRTNIFIIKMKTPHKRFYSAETECNKRLHYHSNDSNIQL